MMPNERDKGLGILLQILSGKQDEQFSEISGYTDTVIQLAGMHRVSYPLLLFAQNHPGMFTPLQLEGLGIRCRKNAMQSLGQLQELIRVTACFEKAGISVVVIKGPQLARMIYGREASKESVDLDLMLVHESGLEQAHVLLAELGYTQSDLNSHPGKTSRKIFLIAKREVHYYNPEKRCHIDLHIRPGSNAYLTAGLFRNFFISLGTYDLEGNLVQVLPSEKYLVYLWYHGGLHQFSRLGWLMDIRAFLALKRDELDFAKVAAIALEIHAERSLFLAMTLLNQFFGDELPVVLEQAMTQKKRLGFLAKNCRAILSRDNLYGFTIQGRVNKLIYMMVLIKGVAGRIDLLYGIFMRFLAARIQKRIRVS
jgi:hypothetical protein